MSKSTSVTQGTTVKDGSGERGADWGQKWSVSHGGGTQCGTQVGGGGRSLRLDFDTVTGVIGSRDGGASEHLKAFHMLQEWKRRAALDFTFTRSRRGGVKQLCTETLLHRTSLTDFNGGKKNRNWEHAWLLTLLWWPCCRWVGHQLGADICLHTHRVLILREQLSLIICPQPTPLSNYRKHESTEVPKPQP